ncbi:membrane associated rhomboid family serine protease [Chitinophaga polysaccharea]|uniref:Membrane associated rhomboid family serine protease n=1 Tax=Chitinophaga polysaccharea TaxID=1293035 RepID=A0A561PWU7_9BACT|nr:rhomboid family intramembrane serine protease [Chitinophaga polysaccharea]TWF42586.1 membrane associated rhomboid family serine protease [Chitinophaga polysaccharea]
MKKLLTKFKIAFLPFILIIVSLLVGYTFLNWLIFVYWDVSMIRDDIHQLFIPMVLAGVAVIVYLRPRIKQLNLDNKRDTGYFLYQIVAWIFIITPLVIAQYYMVSATGKLTKLNSINEIKQPLSRYYQLDHFYIDKHQAGIDYGVEIGGKNNENFGMMIYVALPIYAQAGDTLGNTCQAWYGIVYTKSISNRLNDEKKRAAYKQFLADSEAAFDSLDVTQFSFLKRAENNDDRDGLRKAIKKSSKYSNAAAPVLLLPKKTPFSQKDNALLQALLIALIVVISLWCIMVLIPGLKEPVKKASDDLWQELWLVLRPRRGFFMTPLLGCINVLVWVAMIFAGIGVISFHATDLLPWRANFGPLTLHGEWWRLLTCIFLHGGAMHLFSNMVGLMLVGVLLEEVVGSYYFLFLYLLTGIIASTVSVYWRPDAIGVGASGAIFGLAGVLAALLLARKFPTDTLTRKTLSFSMLSFVGINLLIGLTGAVDNAAHIGGLVSGFLLGLISPYLIKKQLDLASCRPGFYFSNVLPADYAPILISGEDTRALANFVYVVYEDADTGIKSVYEIRSQFHVGQYGWQAFLAGQLLVIGHEDFFYLYDLKQQSNLLRLELNGYFGQCREDNGHFFVTDSTGIYCIDKQGRVRWHNDNLAIDGVIINSFEGKHIKADGEWDPPGGWRPFVLDAATGELLSS